MIPLSVVSSAIFLSLMLGIFKACSTVIMSSTSYGCSVLFISGYFYVL